MCMTGRSDRQTWFPNNSKVDWKKTTTLLQLIACHYLRQFDHNEIHIHRYRHVRCGNYIPLKLYPRKRMILLHWFSEISGVLFFRMLEIIIFFFSELQWKEPTALSDRLWQKKNIPAKRDSIVYQRRSLSNGILDLKERDKCCWTKTTYNVHATVSYDYKQITMKCESRRLVWIYT